MLPEKWAVYAETEEQTKIISKWCNENAKGVDNTNYRMYPYYDYTHSDFVKDKDDTFRRVNSSVKPGYTQISFETFVNEVVNEGKYEYKVKPEFLEFYKKLTGVSYSDRFASTSTCHNLLKKGGVLDTWAEKVKIEPEFSTITSVEGKEFKYKINEDNICIIEGDTKVFIYPMTIATIWGVLQTRKEAYQIAAIITNVYWTVSLPAPETVNIGCQEFLIEDVLEMIEKFNKKYKK